ncbi:hypothetical protein BDV96DRAFT_500794 [Lophiotrema nucula]|uniref:J domain-containing protein n=1 Tax=Lophiotrema nucula TaxID=690887 RepID=A0A6A5YU48_9PLEO|nr:hypothetical protein BDV96DRAFT_500794 [Lophiotrema nucula]
MPRRRDREEDLEDEEMNDHELGEEDGPPSIDPYAVLELETEATADDVKKAYRKLALKHHPDKAPETDKTAANKKFQEIAFAYAVLSDEARRKRYDLTGSTAETIEGDDDFDWLSFYRQQFEDVVTQDNIKRIADEYKDSAEERRDLLDAYTKKKGNLDAVYGLVMLSDILEDDDRFRTILDEEIEKGTIDSFKAYEKQNNDAARKKAKDKEIKRREQFDKEHSNDFEDAKAKAKSKSKSKKHDVSDMAGLAALIQRKQATRGNFFDQLEAKYAPSPRGKKRATPMEEPPEEMFAAARKKQKENGAKKKAAKKVEEVDDMDDDEEDIVPSDEDEESEEEKPKPKKKGKLTKGKSRAKARA